MCINEPSKLTGAFNLSSRLGKIHEKLARAMSVQARVVAITLSAVLKKTSEIA